MKRIFYVLCIAFIVVFSCSKDNSSDEEVVNDDVTDSIENSIIGGFVYSNNIELTFLNQEGEDLLNDSTNGYLSYPQLYYLVDGEVVKAQKYDPQIGSETGTYLITETDPYILRCFLYEGKENVLSDEDGIITGTSTNYLGFNGEITDTIKTQWKYIEDNGSFYWTTAWIDGNELSNEDGDSFTVVK